MHPASSEVKLSKRIIVFQIKVCYTVTKSPINSELVVCLKWVTLTRLIKRYASGKYKN